MSDRPGERVGPPPRPEAAVPSELRARRDEFVQAFFQRGAAFTGELLLENERLGERVSELETENTRLRAHLATDAAIRDFVSRIDRLEDEKKALLSQRSAAESATSRIHARFAAIEEELGTLANVYVASRQLGSTLELALVLRHLRELLTQFVGVREHGVYLVDSGRKQLVLVGGAAQAGARIPLGGVAPENPGAAVVERVYLTGVRHVTTDVQAAPPADPVACIPLRVDGRVVGVVVVHSVLPQKTQFTTVDFELFELLAAHAGAAIYGAQLYEAAGRVVPEPSAVERGLGGKDDARSSAEGGER